MLKSYLSIIIFSLLLFISRAQENFQKIYLFEDTSALFGDIYVTDSCYFFSAVSGKGAARCDVVFGKLNLNGEVNSFMKYISPNEYNFVYANKTQLDTNYRGNFVLGYKNEIDGLGQFPQVTEINPNGVIENDFTINFFVNENLPAFDEGMVLNSNEDSSFYLYFTYQENIAGMNYQGVMISKMNWLNDTLWTKKIRSANDYIQFAVSEIAKLSDGNLLLAMKERRIFAPSQSQFDWAKIHFYVVDENGTILNHKVFQDSQYCFGGYSVLPLADGGIIHTYFDSRLTGDPGDESFLSRPVIARFDSNFQPVWKDTLLQGFWNLAFYLAPNRLVSVNDTVFAGAHEWAWANEHSIDSVTNWFGGFKAFHTVRVFNRHINGNRLWERDYMYWSPSDSSNEPEYEMRDFELTTDGGFITCGNVKHFDSLNAGKPGQFGYILKTNCLGFLGDPQTAASYSYKDIFKVEFVNESIQAGSYKWIFGDGDTLQTSEYEDTVIHQYPESGEFAVKLIGYGCNGAADTLNFIVNVPEIPDDTTYYSGDGTLLTFYPNPSKTGESVAFYVGNIPQEKVIFELVNELGQIIYEGVIPQGESTYIIPEQFAQGVYFGSLRTEMERLETEKLIVK